MHQHHWLPVAVMAQAQDPWGVATPSLAAEAVVAAQSSEAAHWAVAGQWGGPAELAPGLVLGVAGMAQAPGAAARPQAPEVVGMQQLLGVEVGRRP